MYGSAMKKLLCFAFTLLLSFNVFAVDLNGSDLQGTWNIVYMSGQSEYKNEWWEFTDDQFTQHFGEKTLSPDTFTIKGDVIDLGYSQMKVLVFEGNKMEVIMGGVKYHLEKK